MSEFLFIVFIIFSLDFSNGQYIPPQPTIFPLKPIGIKMSIPDEEGISLVAYHVKFNNEFMGLEAGTIARDIVKVKNGKWTYEDRETKLKEGDIIYYWIHVIYKGLGYNLLEQQHVVNEFYDYNEKPIETSIDPGTSSCRQTSTRAFGPTGELQNVCGGDKIFEETFDSQNEIDKSKWNIVEQFSASPDYEFVVYRSHKENVNLDNGKLIITPTLLDNTCGNSFAENGTLSLDMCTGQSGTRECTREAQGYLILPPIISGRINTKNSFSFQYGRVAIRARIPVGDWIYPVLTLEPLDKDGVYVGRDATFYFQLRVGCALGNPELRSTEGEDLSGHVLRGGFLSRIELHNSPVTTLRINDSVSSKTSSKLWSDEYHLYELIWRPNVINVKVDGEIYGEQKFDSPLQTPFYVTLGVAVGGYTEFPDDCISQGYDKPWKNFKSKALLNFYRSQSTWFNTWKQSGLSLRVDYVKVWAL